MDTGLILEGGGLRGVFTGGILEFFMEKDLYFPYVIGVSAGACNATSYLSRQRGRNKQVTIGYIQDPRYYSYSNIFKGKDILGMDFLFDEIPKRLCPLDFETFRNSKEKFVIVTTDCETGQAVYFDKSEFQDDDEYGLVVRASSSLPFMTTAVSLRGYTLLDGGIADSIPIRKAQQDGMRKNVVLLTRERGYRKSVSNMGRGRQWMLKKMYGQYPKLIEAIVNRSQMYNETLAYIEALEDAGEILVIRPQEPVKVKRIERDIKKLEALYDQGYQLAKQMYPQVIEYMT